MARFGMGALFLVLTCAFAGIAVAAALAGRWVIAVAAARARGLDGELRLVDGTEENAPLARILSPWRANRHAEPLARVPAHERPGAPRPADRHVRAARQVRRRPARLGAAGARRRGRSRLVRAARPDRRDRALRPDRDIKFETYAMSRIKGAIIDELRALDWVPRSVRSRAREIERAIGELEAKTRPRADATRRSRRRSASPTRSSTSRSPTSRAPRSPRSTSSGRSRARATRSR